MRSMMMPAPGQLRDDGQGRIHVPMRGHAKEHKLCHQIDILLDPLDRIKPKCACRYLATIGR